MRTAQGLPIERDHFLLTCRPRQHMLDRLHPTQEAAPKLLRIQPGEDAPKRVMRRDPVFQLQKGGELRLFRFAKLLDLDPGVRPTDHRTQGNRENVQQPMPLRALHTRVV